MRDGWRRIALGEVLSPDVDSVAVDPAATYRLAGVYSFGRGLFEREPLLGANTSYKVLHRLRRWQLVMSKLKAWEGALAVVPEAFHDSVLSPEFPTFTAHDDLDPRFLMLLSAQPAFWRVLQDQSQGIGGRRERVHPRRLLDVQVLLPPLNEQRRIVDLVAAIDMAAQATNREAQAARLSQRAFLSDMLHSSTGSDVALEELFTVNIGGVWGNEAGVNEIDVDVYRSTEFTDDGIPLTENTKARRSITNRQLANRNLLRDDILLEKSGGTPNRPVGRVVRVEVQSSRAVCGNFVQLLRVNPEKANGSFIFWVLWSWYNQGRTVQFQNATTNIRNLSVKRYLSQRIALPERSVQEDVARTADAMVAMILQASDALQALLALREAVVSDLLSGSHAIPESYDKLLEATG